MARKKNVEENEQEQLEVTQETENTGIEPVVAPEPQTTTVTGEIPSHVKKLLETYTKYPALYIDVKGGVYTEATQPNLRGDAILYQNPYYKQ